MNAANLAICDSAFALIREGNTARQVAKILGVSRSTLMDWIHATPETTARYAQARDQGWDAMAELALEEACDKSLDPKDRRIRLEARLKLLARWCPARYGEALLLKHEVVDDRPPMTTDEVVAELIRLAKEPVPLLLPSPDVVDGEFTPVAD